MWGFKIRGKCVVSGFPQCVQTTIYVEGMGCKEESLIPLNPTPWTLYHIPQTINPKP